MLCVPAALQHWFSQRRCDSVFTSSAEYHSQSRVHTTWPSYCDRWIKHRRRQSHRVGTETAILLCPHLVILEGHTFIIYSLIHIQRNILYVTKETQKRVTTELCGINGRHRAMPLTYSQSIYSTWTLFLTSSFDTLDYGQGHHYRHNIVIFSIYSRFTLWLSMCETKVLDACEFMENGTSLSSPHCQNEGTCVNGSLSDSPGSFNCVCAPGFTGAFCQYSTLTHSTGLVHRFIVQLNTRCSCF